MGEKGSTRVVGPGDFIFEEGRPVRGIVDGRRVEAEDRLPTDEGRMGSLLSGGSQ